MTTKQKYLIACDYAVRQLVKTGSSQLSIIKGNAWIDVPFAEVLNWLEEEYDQTNVEESEVNNEVKEQHPCSDCPQGAECYGLFGHITEPRRPCEHYEKYKKARNRG